MDDDDIWEMFDMVNQNDRTIIVNDTIEPSFDKCPICESSQFIYEDGNNICSKCGLFQEKQLSETLEYRYYGDNDNKHSNPERVGMPTNILLPKSSLGSLIGGGYSGNLQFKKMRQYNGWNSMPYRERSQWKVFNDISSKCIRAGIPNIIIENAKSFYKTISETSISRGSNRNGIIAACVYISCKKENVPRSTKEISEIFGIELQDMTKGCKRFKEIWRISDSRVILDIISSNPLDYIDRFCSNLSVSVDIKSISEFIAVKAITAFNKLVEDNTAPSIAAGSIYLACSVCNKNITKKDVSKACKISEVTISKCYKKLKKKTKYLFPKIIVTEYNLNS